MRMAVQANATMRRTLRPVKPSVTTTGNKMLDIAIRMAGTLEQQEKDATDALLAQSVACCTCNCTCKSIKLKDITADGFKRLQFLQQHCNEHVPFQHYLKTSCSAAHVHSPCICAADQGTPKHTAELVGSVMQGCWRKYGYGVSD